MSEYPREEYVLGLGRGMTQEAADDAARAEISKVFRVFVGQTTEGASTYDEAQTSQGDEAWGRTAAVSQSTWSESRKVLSGIEMAARHHGRGNFVSLAVLSRRKASESLHAQATTLANTAIAMMKQGRESEDPLVAARGYYQASRALTDLDAVNADLRVLRIHAPVTGPATADQARDAFLDKVNKTLRFSVTISGDDAGRLSLAVLSALSARGIESTPGKARIRVEGQCSIRPVERLIKDWLFVRFNLSLNAMEGDRNVIASVGPISEDASGRTPDQARERACFVMRKQHVDPFVETLLDRLFGGGDGQKETK